MTDALALLCSPRPQGVSDTLAQLFSEGAAEAGLHVSLVPLRDYSFSACTGCMGCANPPHHCVFHDQAEELFALFITAPLVLVTAPIYFYALPAQCKAFIDRAQRYWAAREFDLRHGTSGKPLIKPVLAGLTASRKLGKKLFSGALLTLKYFLEPLDAQLHEARFLRGVQQPEDLLQQPVISRDIRAWGHRWGKRVMCLNNPMS